MAKRKMTKEEARWMVLMISGVVFIAMAFILAVRAVMASGAFPSIAMLLVLGLGIGGWGYYKWRRIRDVREGVRRREWGGQ